MQNNNTYCALNISMKQHFIKTEYFRFDFIADMFYLIVKLCAGAAFTKGLAKYW